MFGRNRRPENGEKDVLNALMAYFGDVTDVAGETVRAVARHSDFFQTCAYIVPEKVSGKKDSTTWHIECRAQPDKAWTVRLIARATGDWMSDDGAEPPAAETLENVSLDDALTISAALESRAHDEKWLRCGPSREELGEKHYAWCGKKEGFFFDLSGKPQHKGHGAMMAGGTFNEACSRKSARLAEEAEISTPSSGGYDGGYSSDPEPEKKDEKKNTQPAPQQQAAAVPVDTKISSAFNTRSDTVKIDMDEMFSSRNTGLIRETKRYAGVYMEPLMEEMQKLQQAVTPNSLSARGLDAVESAMLHTTQSIRAALTGLPGTTMDRNFAHMVYREAISHYVNASNKLYNHMKATPGNQDRLVCIVRSMSEAVEQYAARGLELDTKKVESLKGMIMDSTPPTRPSEMEAFIRRFSEKYETFLTAQKKTGAAAYHDSGAGDDADADTKDAKSPARPAGANSGNQGHGAK